MMDVLSPRRRRHLDVPALWRDRKRWRFRYAAAEGADGAQWPIAFLAGVRQVAQGPTLKPASARTSTSPPNSPINGSGFAAPERIWCTLRLRDGSAMRLHRSAAAHALYPAAAVILEL
jgi:hypothetical protein